MKKSCKSCHKIILVILFSYIFLLSLFKIANFDIWMHLKIGENIIKSQSIPRVDTFSYTAFDKPWVYHEWLSSIVLYSIYYLFGTNGLVLFKGFIVIAISFILYRTYKRINIELSIFIFLIIFSNIVSHARLIVRPELFSLLFSTYFMSVFFIFLKKDTGLIYTLPFVMILWVNLHGGFLVGIAISCIIAFSEETKYWVSNHLSFQIGDVLTIRKKNRLRVIVILTIGAILINPYGLQLVYKIFDIINSHQLQKTFFIGEWAPPKQWPEYKSFWLYLSFIIFAAIVNLKKPDIRDILLLLFILYLSFSSRRNIGIIAYLALPILGVYIQNIYKFLYEFIGSKSIFIRNNSSRLGWCVSILLTSTVLYTYYYHEHHNYSELQWGLGVLAKRQPDRAVEFMEQHNINGKMYNSHSFGSYLIWKGKKVFQDGRNELHYDQIRDTHTMRLDQLTEKYQFDIAVADYTGRSYMAQKKKVTIDSAFNVNPQWALIYFDDTARIYLRRTEKNRHLINNLTYKYIEPDEGLPYITKLLDRNLPPSLLINELKENIQRAGDNLRTYSLLGEVYLKTHSYGESINAFKKAGSIDFYKLLKDVIHNRLGINYYRIGNLKEAYSHYKKAIRINPKNISAIQNTGMVLIKLNRKEEAISYLKEALYQYPDNPRLHFALSMAYYSLGMAENGKQEYDRYKKIITNNDQINF